MLDPKNTLLKIFFVLKLFSFGNILGGSWVSLGGGGGGGEASPAPPSLDETLLFAK